MDLQACPSSCSWATAWEALAVLHEVCPVDQVVDGEQPPVEGLRVASVQSVAVVVVLVAFVVEVLRAG